MITNKIICVGQPKTGTKTLRTIFAQLAKTTNNDPWCRLKDNGDECIQINNGILIDTNNFFNNIDYFDKNLEMFDFFHDIPYSFNYELIDKKYPNSKFILTIRDEEEWFKSLFHYQNIPGASNKIILNVIYHHEIIFIEHKEEVIKLYRKYNNDVIRYFKKTPEKLLIINLCDKSKNESEITKKICTFTKLNKNNKFVFPHENSQIYP